jgi:beta-mannosidase
MPLPRFAVVLLTGALMLKPIAATAQAIVQTPVPIATGWQMQDAAKVTAAAELLSTAKFKPEPDAWYSATVPGTVLTTLVNNKVYPEPLYGENMRLIPESLNKTSYWYRTTFAVPAAYKGRRTWLHFGGINYSSEIWVNGQRAGTTRGAFIRTDLDISAFVRPGTTATLAVLVAPQPHPGTPIEHTVANGVGKNGGDTAIDGPTFLSTIGWDWLPAVRDRDTGIYQPVTLYSTGPVVLKDPVVRAELAEGHESADLTVATTLRNETSEPVTGTLRGVIRSYPASDKPAVVFEQALTVGAKTILNVSLDTQSTPSLHMEHPALWWPNGYGAQNLYELTLTFEAGKTNTVSDTQTTNFGIRKIEYSVADSENLTLSVNGVKIMARGGNWGLDEAMKRVPRERLDAQFHMHALANLNIIRNWVGQSTNPDFYDMADKYGILLWDEFFQPNPSDGPNVTDIPTYLANVEDKVLHYRNHPAIAVWCARNEGYPPKALDDQLKVIMAKLDPTRLYQSNSADGRGVHSGGPYYWRSPRFFYDINESFKTETGSVSVPTIESIQGMMPEKDWETQNDDWAQHDMAHGAQRGDAYPSEIAKRYGPVRNLADFVRKSQLANYEAFRAMYEGRNAQMFKATTGVITWMSHPAQPSFVWQLYHYDLEPNAALYGAKKAAEQVHVQLNEGNFGVEIVNNTPGPLIGLKVRATEYSLEGKVFSEETRPVASVPGSATLKAFEFVPETRQALYFVKLDLTDSTGKLLSTNFYWQNVAQDDFTGLAALPTATLDITATSRIEGANTLLTVTLRNPTKTVALMTHLQLHQKSTGNRVLPVFYSDNYVSLVPGESREVTIEAATKDLAGDPSILVDGYNIGINAVTAPVSISLNENAQPAHWPASNLVPNPSR